MNSSALTRGVEFKKATVREAAVLLAVAGLVPFLVHLVPWSGERPLGAHLLPMFWATFVAAYFYGPRLAVAVGVFAPGLNLALTGLPMLNVLGLLALELAIFALVASWAVRRWSRFVLLAPLAYLVAKGVATVVLGAVGGLGDAGVGEIFARGLVGGSAGLVVLAAINAALVWFYPKTRDEADDAAGV